METLWLFLETEGLLTLEADPRLSMERLEKDFSLLELEDWMVPPLLVLDLGVPRYCGVEELLDLSWDFTASVLRVEEAGCWTLLL